MRIPRPVLFVAGLVFLGLGALGVFLPLLPTTPFVLLAAACFSRSSRRLHGWLLDHRLFGPVLRDWDRYGAIALRVKVVATVMMVGLVSYPVLFLDLRPGIRTAAVLSVLGVLAFVWTRPSARRP